MSGGLRLFWVLASLLVLTAAAVAADSSVSGSAPAGPPKVKTDDVQDTVQGHKIADPYRWMENASSPETRQYVEQELAYTRSVLDPLPGRDQIQQRLTQLISVGSIGTPQIAGKYYLYSRRTGTQNQPILYVREGLQGKDRVLVDVNGLSADGTVALDWWYPSEDGKYVAYGTSPSGSEESTLHIIDVASGKLLPDAIERTRFASLAWKKDNSGFYYTRHPKKGDVAAGEEVYHVKVFYHAVGSDSANDALLYDPEAGGKHSAQDIPQIVLPDDDDRYLLITVFEGWAKSEMYLQDLKAGTPPVELTTGKEFLYSGEILQGKLYITSNEDAPRYRMFVADVAAPQRENWKELIPQSDAVLQGTGIFGGEIFAQYEKNATSQLKLFSLDGKLVGNIALPAIGSVKGTGGRYNRKEAFYSFESFTVAPSVYHLDLNQRQSTLWGKVDAPVDSAGFEVAQVWYTSRDGTKVPMFLFHKKGVELNGKNPTLLTGYGGFNISMTPSFVATRFVWLEHGGVFAVANLRGGAEFGEDWHRAGMLDKKQNVFDDFISAAEFLISDKITDKEHLAIQGGSNGGLLMGAAFTQRPDLFRAVVCQVPLLDMLRYQNFQIAKLWIPEYGSAENPSQFDFIYAYSPYHHVKAGTEYPAILFMTADTDTRVDPMHAKKMAALMQAEAANGQSRERPILLRIESKAGHGAGKPVAKQIEEGVDIYSFLFWQLGVKP
jgi:prolyl oligopeptidase